MDVTEDLELARSQLQEGKQAFERGAYRQSIECLEKAMSLSPRGSLLGGEIQLWLVTAYQAAGQLPEAIALCEVLGRHPDLNVRKESKRLIYILKAPQLKTRPEWLTQIPDLASLDEAAEKRAYSPTSTAPSRPRPQPEPKPVDLSQVNTKDNGFVWLVLAATGSIVALLWLTQ